MLRLFWKKQTKKTSINSNALATLVGAAAGWVNSRISLDVHFLLTGSWSHGRLELGRLSRGQEGGSVPCSHSGPQTEGDLGSLHGFKDCSESQEDIRSYVCSGSDIYPLCLHSIDPTKHKGTWIYIHWKMKDLYRSTSVWWKTAICAKCIELFW